MYIIAGSMIIDYKHVSMTPHERVQQLPSHSFPPRKIGGHVARNYIFTSSVTISDKSIVTAFEKRFSSKLGLQKYE